MKKHDHNLQAEIEEMEAIIRRRGGIVGHNPGTPDWIRYMFLKQVVDCPHCKKLDPQRH